LFLLIQQGDLQGNALCSVNRPNGSSKRILAFFLLSPQMLYTACIVTCKAQILLRQLCDKIRDFVAEIVAHTVRGLCRKHLDMSRWFVSATVKICVMEFGLKLGSAVTHTHRLSLSLVPRRLRSDPATAAQHATHSGVQAWSSQVSGRLVPCRAC